MKDVIKLWYFSLTHPVDILIACDYVNKQYPDKTGSEPSVSWTWLDKDAYSRFHYSDRVSIPSIVFDPVLKFWMLNSNAKSCNNFDFNQRILNLFGSNPHPSGINSPKTCLLRHKFDECYVNKMDEARRECSLPQYMLDMASRVADIELREEDAKLMAMRKREREMADEYRKEMENIGKSGMSCQRGY